MEVALSDISPPKFRLRSQIGDLEELKASIRDKGLLHPLIIRPVNKHYEIISGHRRYVCLRELGVTVSDCVIKKVDDKEAFEIALTENVQRDQMDIIDEAKAYKLYLTEQKFGSLEELASKINKSSSYVTNALRRLKLPDEVIDKVRSGSLSKSAAEEIARVEPKRMNEIADITTEYGLTSMQTRSAVNLVNAGYDSQDAVRQVQQFPYTIIPEASEAVDKVDRAREQIISMIDQAHTFINLTIASMPDGEEKPHWIQEVKYPIHQAKDTALKLRKRFR